MKLRCPNCNKQLNVPDTARGKRGRCPSCKEVFVLEPPEQELQRPEPIGLADDSGDYNPFLDALNRDAEKAQPAGRQDAEAQGDWAGASGSGPAASGPVAGSGDWASAGPAQPAPTGGRKKKKRGASPSRSDSAAGPSSLSENPALRIATLVCACLIGVGLFLPWYSAKNEELEFITIKLAWMAPAMVGGAVSFMGRMAGESTVSLTFLGIGLNTYCLGSIAAVIAALTSIRDWQMRRVFIPSVVAAIGALCFVIGIGMVEGKAGGKFDPNLNPLGIICPLISLAALVLSALQVNWRGAGKLLANLGGNVSQPATSPNQFSSTYSRPSGNVNSPAGFSIAAIVLGLIAISAWYYPWLKMRERRDEDITFSPAQQSAMLIVFWSAEEEIDTSKMQDDEKSEFNALRCQLYGASLYGLGLSVAVISTIVLLAHGSWSFKPTGIGGAIALAGALLFAIGWMWLRSVISDSEGGEEALKKMGLTFAFYLGIVQVLATTAVGFMSD